MIGAAMFSAGATKHWWWMAAAAGICAPFAITLTSTRSGPDYCPRPAGCWSIPGAVLGFYLTEVKHRPGWLRVDRLLGEHGIARDTASGRREFEGRMESRRAGEGEAGPWKGMRRGWCFGTADFKKGLLERLQGHLGPNHSGRLRQEAGQAGAEALISKALRRLGWKEEELGKRAKSDPGKVRLAAQLRQETTLTIGQIAQRLHMGTRNTLATNLQGRKGTNG